MSVANWFTLSFYIIVIVSTIELPDSVKWNGNPVSSPLTRVLVMLIALIVMGTCLIGAGYLAKYVGIALMALGKFLLFL